MKHHAYYDNGFGFKKDVVKNIEVFSSGDSWDEFGSDFYIRDEKHIIISGPVYFLARKAV